MSLIIIGTDARPPSGTFHAPQAERSSAGHAVDQCPLYNCPGTTDNTLILPYSAVAPGQESAMELQGLLNLGLLLLPRDTPRPSAKESASPPATANNDRSTMALKMGEAVALSLNIPPQAHSPAALMALGRQSLIASAESQEGLDIGLLIAAAGARGYIDEADIGNPDPEHLARRLDAFVQAEFADEIAFHAAAERLGSLEMPTRRGLARNLLETVGVNPDKPLIKRELHELKVTTAILNHLVPGALSTPPFTPAQRYFINDTLTEEHLRSMWTAGDIAPTPDQAREILARLPASLDAEFHTRFDAYVNDAATQISILLRTRLTLLAKANGIDLSSATVSISKPTLQYYANEILPLRGSAVMYDGPTQATVQPEGYIYEIRSDGLARRFFVSLTTGLSVDLPPDSTTRAWVESNQASVFGMTRPAEAGDPRLKTRVGLDAMATGGTAIIGDQLATAFRRELEQAREAARSQTPRERAVDVLLDLIPFRSMIVAIQRDDVYGAIVAGGLDILTLIPLLSTSGKLARIGMKAAKQGLLASAVTLRSPRLVAAAMNVSSTPLMSKAGVRSISYLAVPLRDAVGKEVAQGAAKIWTRIRIGSLDPERMAAGLGTSHPRMADSLRGAARSMRGMDITDGKWRVPGPSMRTSNPGIAVKPTVTAQDGMGATLPLQQYGQSQAYTRFDPATGQGIGSLLLVGRDNLLYRSLPLETVRRYRVTSSGLLQQLETRRAGPNGVIALQDNVYVRIGEDYIEVVADRATSIMDRPIWRVVPPASIAPDVLVHRIAYDTDNAIWREARIPKLEGGGGRISRTSTGTPVNLTSSPPTPSHRELHPFRHDVRARYHNLVGRSGRDFFIMGADDQVRRAPGGHGGGGLGDTVPLDDELVRYLDQIADYSHSHVLGEMIAGYHYDAEKSLVTYQVDGLPVSSLDQEHSLYALRQTPHAQYMVAAGSQRRMVRGRICAADACAQMMLAEGKTPAQVAAQLLEYQQFRLRLPSDGEPVRDMLLPLAAQLNGSVVAAHMRKASHQETISRLVEALEKDAPVVLFRRSKPVVLDAIEVSPDGTWLTIRNPVTASQVRIRDHQEFWLGDDWSRRVTPVYPDFQLEHISIVTMEHAHRRRHLDKAARQATTP
jgi:hypothetical protein